MAKFDYVNAHAVAVKLITKFGQAGELVIKGNASGWLDGKPVAAEPDTLIDCIVTPLLRYKQHEIDGEHVLSTDSYVFVEVATEPEIGMMITINSYTYRVVNLVTMTSVDDIRVYQRLQLRK